MGRRKNRPPRTMNLNNMQLSEEETRSIIFDEISRLSLPGGIKTAFLDTERRSRLFEYPSATLLDVSRMLTQKHNVSVFLVEQLVDLMLVQSENDDKWRCFLLNEYNVEGMFYLGCLFSLQQQVSFNEQGKDDLVDSCPMGRHMPSVVLFGRGSMYAAMAHETRTVSQVEEFMAWCTGRVKEAEAVQKKEGHSDE